MEPSHIIAILGVMATIIGGIWTLHQSIKSPLSKTAVIWP